MERYRFSGRFVVTDADHGILGRNVLNALVLLLDGPRGEWSVTGTSARERGGAGISGSSIVRRVCQMRPSGELGVGSWDLGDGGTPHPARFARRPLPRERR